MGAEKITLLGFCSGAIPIIAEMASESFSCQRFDVVKNIQVKDADKPFMWHDFKFSVCDHIEYDFTKPGIQFFFGVNTPHIRYIIYHFFYKKYGVDRSQYVNLLHPSAYFSRSSEISNGFLLEPLSVVSSFVKTGFGVFIKRNCSVGHHVIIDDFVSIHPGVNISGNVHIGEGVVLGTGSSVKDGVTIGKHALIGMGSVVTKDVPEGMIVFGNPCRVVRRNDVWDNLEDRLASQIS